MTIGYNKKRLFNIEQALFHAFSLNAYQHVLLRVVVGRAGLCFGELTAGVSIAAVRRRAISVVSFTTCH